MSVKSVADEIAYANGELAMAENQLYNFPHTPAQTRRLTNKVMRLRNRIVRLRYKYHEECAKLHRSTYREAMSDTARSKRRRY